LWMILDADAVLPSGREAWPGILLLPRGVRLVRARPPRRLYGAGGARRAHLAQGRAPRLFAVATRHLPERPQSSPAPAQAPRRRAGAARGDGGRSADAGQLEHPAPLARPAGSPRRARSRHGRFLSRVIRTTAVLIVFFG